MKLEYHITRLILIFATVIMLATSCSGIYQYRKQFDINKPVITHVLALTNTGDTVKIPINEIKPQRLYNVVGYDFYNPHIYDRSYNRYRYNWYDQYYNYNRNFGHYQGAQNSGYKIQYNNISPSSQPTSSGIVGGSGTSGFSGNPVASNPVTSSGGAKKKN